MDKESMTADDVARMDVEKKECTICRLVLVLSIAIFATVFIFVAFMSYRHLSVPAWAPVSETSLPPLTKEDESQRVQDLKDTALLFSSTTESNSLTNEQ